MCIQTCPECHKWLGTYPCMFHIEPERYKELHPIKFKRFTKEIEEAKKNHICKKVVIE
jgi:hypothetical protein